MLAHGSGERHVQRDARFTHTGSGGHKDKLGFIEAESHPVKVGKAGRDAGDLVSGGRGLGQLIKHALHDRGHRHKSADIAPLTQRVYAPLRGFEHRLRFAGALVDHAVYLVRRFAETAQQRAVAHYRGILHDVCRRRRDAHDLGDVRVVILLIHAPDLHLVKHCDGVDGLPVGEHGVHCLINIPVELHIELIRLQLFQHLRDAPGVYEHRAYDRLLRRCGVRCFFAQQFVHYLIPQSGLAA